MIKLLAKSRFFVSANHVVEPGEIFTTTPLVAADLIGMLRAELVDPDADREAVTAAIREDVRRKISAAGPIARFMGDASFASGPWRPLVH